VDFSSIDDLADHLAWLASDYGDRDDRRAYFAGLYALMTATVATDVRLGRFEDGERMELSPVPSPAATWPRLVLSMRASLHRPAGKPPQTPRDAGGQSSFSTSCSA